MIAYAEKGKSVILKDGKFNTRRIYGIKKSSMQGEPVAIEDGIRRYLAKVSIFNLSSINKRFVLNHYFDEYFYIQ